MQSKLRACSQNSIIQAFVLLFWFPLPVIPVGKEFLIYSTLIFNINSYWSVSFQQNNPDVRPFLPYSFARENTLSMCLSLSLTTQAPTDRSVQERQASRGPKWSVFVNPTQGGPKETSGAIHILDWKGLGILAGRGTKSLVWFAIENSHGLLLS